MEVDDLLATRGAVRTIERPAAVRAARGQCVRLFLLDGAATGQGDLDQHDAVVAVDVQVVAVVDEPPGWVLGDHLEAVVGRDGDGLDHRRVDDVADGG